MRWGLPGNHSSVLLWTGFLLFTLFFRICLEATPLHSPGNLKPFAWHALFDVNMDTYPDWDVIIGGISETLTSKYNPAIDDIPEVVRSTIKRPLTEGSVRLISAGYSTYPNATYMDFQVPFTALQVPGYTRNVTYDTPFRFILTTSYSESTKQLKDFIGTTSSMRNAFPNVITNCQKSFGLFYDNRDPMPYTSGGNWSAGETILASGNSWHKSTSPYYAGGVRNVRVLNASQTQVWSGSITTNSSGVFSNLPTWTLPAVPTAGLYTFWVQDPRSPGTYNRYDSFTVLAVPPPIMSIQKSASPTQINAGSNTTYTIVLSNSGTGTAYITQVSDALPAGFSYVSGSTTGISTAAPTISGQTLTWTGNWNIPPHAPPTSISLSFQPVAAAVPGPIKIRPVLPVLTLPP